MFFQAVTRSGAFLAYADVGARDAPVSAYLGGLGTASTVSFGGVVGHPALAGRRHLLVDLVGSGWSDHDDAFGSTIDEHAGTMTTLLDALRLRDITVVGHSLGGSIAISLAAQRPDLVGRLVVAEPNLDPGVGTFSAEIAAFDEDTFAESEHGAIVERLLAEAARGDAVAAEDARTLARWSPRGLHRTAVSLLATRPATFRQQLTDFSGPRHYLSGARSVEDLAQLRASGCDVRVVPDAGHDLMWDNLDGFVAALSDLT